MFTTIATTVAGFITMATLIIVAMAVLMALVIFITRPPRESSKPLPHSRYAQNGLIINGQHDAAHNHWQAYSPVHGERAQVDWDAIRENARNHSNDA